MNPVNLYAIGVISNTEKGGSHALVLYYIQWKEWWSLFITFEIMYRLVETLSSICIATSLEMLALTRGSKAQRNYHRLQRTCLAEDLYLESVLVCFM